jgi:pimeloyl-ACP methyl ester carboxylesterase
MAMADGALRSRWVKVNGVKTHYMEAGDNGPVIVMLHGGGHGSSGHSGMGALMLALQSDFRIVAPDSIGGYGETDVSAATPHGMLNRVDHTREFVDALCLDRFTILGNSQGAFAAARYAMENPERVEKLILVASLTIAQSMGLEQAPTAAMKALMGYDGTPAAMRLMLEGLVVDRSKITDELIARRQASATRPGAMEAMDRYLKATGGLNKHPVLSMHMNLRESLPRLTKVLPTAFFWGDDDPFALAETGHKLEPLLPDVKFHWIANAGHQVQTDKPDEMAMLIRQFVLGA